MLKFGFELEGFFEDADGVCIPPKEYPTDGFPGLVELRTSGGKLLEDAYAELVCLNLKHPGVNFGRHGHVFSPKQKAELRRRQEQKTAWDIQNIYGRYPRPLGNRTIASLQISVSNLLRPAYTDDKGVKHSDSYGVFDVPKIIRALDDEFADEIKQARRQPGEYAIKNSLRLEYRSLPNFVCSFRVDEARSFLNRVKTTIQGEAT